MKRIKKILAILLVTIMAFAALPLTAFAATWVSSVAVSNVITPVDGQKAQYTFGIDNSGRYTVKKLGWIELDHEPTSYLDATQNRQKYYADSAVSDLTFKANKYYVAIVILKLNSGYIFNVSKISATINGKAVTFYRGVDNEQMEMNILYNFGQLKSTSVAVTGVTLNKTSSVLKVGETDNLTATVSPGNATDKKVTFTSSDTAVATVDANGKVTAKKEGTATVTATAVGGKKATCTVTVKPKDTPKPKYTVTASVNGGHGTVKVEDDGADALLIFVPDNDYEIDWVTVNGVKTGVLANVLGITMNENKTVVVKYKKISTATSTPPKTTATPNTSKQNNTSKPAETSKPTGEISRITEPSSNVEVTESAVNNSVSTDEPSSTANDTDTNAERDSKGNGNLTNILLIILIAVVAVGAGVGILVLIKKK